LKNNEGIRGVGGAREEGEKGWKNWDRAVLLKGKKKKKAGKKQASTKKRGGIEKKGEEAESEKYIIWTSEVKKLGETKSVTKQE